MIDQQKDSKLKAFIKEFRQEINFVLIFSTGLIICFLVIYTDTVAAKLTKPLTVMETAISSEILNIIGYENQQRGLYIEGRGEQTFRMQVLNTCNGLFESIIFLMAFVAIQVPWRKKMGWMLGGFLFFHIVNEMRLVSLFIVGSKYSHETFVFFHETFWNFAIILVALGTFIFCAFQVTKSPAMKTQDQTASS